MKCFANINFAGFHKLQKEKQFTLKPIGLNSHETSLLKAGTFTPLGMYIDCVISLMSFKGRCIPSKMLPIIPGPSSTDRGLPVRSTGSPTVTPANQRLRNFF